MRRLLAWLERRHARTTRHYNAGHHRPDPRTAVTTRSRRTR